MKSHTQGNWHWYWRQVDGKADCGVYAEPREGQAYSVCRAPQFQDIEQWEADARLIACAPELLDMVKELQRNCSCPYGDCSSCDKAKNIVARAEGRS